MKVYRTTVTPKKAAEWLKTNTRNRPISQSRVVSYAEQIKAGRWKLTGETIKFDTTGVLMDGQHRLNAIVMANADVETYIAEGLEAESFDCLDRVFPRSLAHAFGREKKAHYNMLAAAVRLLWLLENDEPIQGGHALQIEDGWNVLARHPAVERFCSLVSTWNGPSCPLPTSVIAAFATWTYEKHGDKATTFWHRVATGEELKHGSPECVLYKRLVADLQSPSRVHRDARTAYCVKAFNAYITGKRLWRLSFDMSKEQMPVFA